MRTKLYLGSLLVGLLWLPSVLWAAPGDDIPCILGADTNAVSVYSLSGQGNLTCEDLSMGDVQNIVPTVGLTLDWTLPEDAVPAEVDTVVVEDANGKRCVYNYGPGATGGSGLAPPSDKPISDYLICADGNIVAAPNNPPEVVITVITDPSDGGGYPGGTAIEFAGSVNDDEDGDLSSELAWNSSIDGALGSGASLTVSDLSAGEHNITAQVTDTGGLVGSATIVVMVTAVVAQNCEVVDGGTAVLINGVEVFCPVSDPGDPSQPRLVCSADLSANADKFELGNAACCLCNATATECDADRAEFEGPDPVTGLEPCPDSTALKGALQVPSTLMFNNDPYYCYTIGGKRTCFAY